MDLKKPSEARLLNPRRSEVVVSNQLRKCYVHMGGVIVGLGYMS